MKANDNNLEKFHKLHHINPGIVAFAFIFLYVLVCVILGSKETSIVGYQVKNGMLSENRLYTGIALRKENVVVNEDTGYAALLVKEGERVAFNNLVYAIDESNTISSLTTKDPSEDTGLGKGELENLRQDVVLFSKEFDSRLFQDAVYFERSVAEEIGRYENRALLMSVDELNSQHINDIINFYRSPGTGIVTYYYDGYEDKRPENLSKEDFDVSKYSCEYVYNDSLVEAGNFIYKYTDDENWSLCIFVPKEELLRLEEDDYVTVKFSKTNTTSWGRVHIVNISDEGAIVSLSFTNSMVSFASDRFVEIELLLEEDTGLKVPNSAIADNSFYLINKNFVVKGVNDKNYGVNRQVVSDTGDVTTKFTEVYVYKETDNEYYVSPIGLNPGDVLYYVETPENASIDHDLTFTVGKQGTLIGVYNINKGYADFKQIEILYSNDEYSIIKSNSATGLRAYDYIALDASVVTDKDFVY